MLLIVSDTAEHAPHSLTVTAFAAALAASAPAAALVKPAPLPPPKPLMILPGDARAAAARTDPTQWIVGAHAVGAPARARGGLIAPRLGRRANVIRV